MHSATIEIPPDSAAESAVLRALLTELGAPADALEQAEEAYGVVTQLTRDAALAAAVMIRSALPGPTSEQLARLTALAGPQALTFLHELTRFGELDLSSRWSAAQGLNLRQAETLRKMLLAVVSDPRLVLARLAVQLVRARHAKGLDADARRRLALESREIYGPLANRLGMWNIKWELEDLAFRDLEPEAYRHIAAALNEKRADRERYIGRVCALLAEKLAEAGLHAQVTGRPKHIYSIHRKMLRKELDFEHVFDVRAVRVIVASVSECYAALGIVHGLWRYLPGEFDDYIATPKGNFYRSIHTAVIGPEDRSLEIQIRTQDMQDHAELGVAAHWLYKEGAAQDKAYERKIQWLRGLLNGASAAMGTALAGDDDFISQVSGNLFSDRIYALTPKGEVIDLPRGATPLDFAYHVHTGLGHRCRGAKVNGRIVPLTHTLANGDVVEIITGKTPAPSRDWLVPEQGYLASGRSRAKVRAWFRALEEKQPVVAAEAPPAEPAPAPARRRTPARIKPARSPVAIEGVGDLPVTLARCCAPVRPEPITGYVTLGRGVTIHAANCPSAARMHKLRPDRGLRVEWAGNRNDELPVAIAIEAFDRRGLLRDVTDLIAERKLSIEGVSSATDPEDRIARIAIRLGVHDLDELNQLLARLKRVPNVLVARRTH